MKEYSKAFVEVLEILSYIPKEEYRKIPEEKIEIFKANMDKDYKFKINPNEELSNQKISKEANAILITIFRDYFATEGQKEKLEKILNFNQKKEEEDKHNKYNPDKIFEKTDIKLEEYKEETNLQEIKKETFFEKFINYIKNIFKKI